jgi:uncharacterized DUF497 family protein
LLYFTKTHLYLFLPYRKILSIIIEKSRLDFFLHPAKTAIALSIYDRLMKIPQFFEWDKDKCQANIDKHGIDFANIQAVFTNPIVERVDNRQDYGETRIILLGIIDNRVLCIVYTLRGSGCRIISARRANQREPRTYHQSLARRLGENEGSN